VPRPLPSLRTLGRASRRLKGKQRERRHGGGEESALSGLRHGQRRGLSEPRAVLAPYVEQHPLLYHLAGSEAPRKFFVLAGPEIEALFLAADWISKAERGRFSERALVRRLDKLERRLEQVMDEIEPSPDFEQIVYEGYDEAEQEVGDEDLLWKGQKAERLPPMPDPSDIWRAGEAKHLLDRGLVIDEDLLKKQSRGTGKIGMTQGWVEIDGRAVRYAEKAPWSEPYPGHTWHDPKTGRTYPGRKYPYPPALYADKGDPVPRYHELVPSPRYARDTPATWRRRKGTFKDTHDRFMEETEWQRYKRKMGLD
jgi:hypothetical protein